MEVQFKFVLPEEQHEYTLFAKSPNMLAALDEIDRMLRSACKYGTIPYEIDFTSHNEQMYVNIDNLRDYFYEVLAENDVQIN